MIRKKIYTMFCILGVLLLTSMVCAAEDVSTYLILDDIPPYQRLTRVIDMITEKIKTIPGYSIYNNEGILAGAYHFSLDHSDTSYETKYQSEELDMGMKVQVTQHAGGDSDKWLLHEVEDGYRNSDDRDEGLGNAYGKVREISGQRVIYSGIGGGNFTWVNNNIVVNIEYTDLYRQKSEPLEVITAYLQKFPSTIPTTLALDNAHDRQWTKDEMERRLWLCDKWLEQLAAGKTDQKNALEYVIKSMNVFLDYREKYYRWSALEEKNLLAHYQQTGNEVKIREKLQEYKDWWSANKSTSLIGMITTCPQRIWSQVRFYFKRLLVQLTSLPDRIMTMLYAA